MHNSLCDIYGIDVPIFAFSHSPAVVLAVTKAGGFGVLGAAGLEPEELDRALKKISEECAGKAFGIDLIIPDNYVGSEQGGLTVEELQKHIPQGHRDFVDGLLDQYHVPPLSAPRQTFASRAGLGISLKRGTQLVDIALSYPVKLIVNALGVPQPISSSVRTSRGCVWVPWSARSSMHCIRRRLVLTSSLRKALRRAAIPARLPAWC